jgi:hypothetical protein
LCFEQIVLWCVSPGSILAALRRLIHVESKSLKPEAISNKLVAEYTPTLIIVDATFSVRF